MYLLFGSKRTLQTEVGSVIYNSLLKQHDPDTAQRSMEGCKGVQRMRGEVVTVSGLGTAAASKSATEALLGYYCAIELVSNLIEIENNVQLKFTWHDSFTDAATTSSSLEVERTAVIFNVGVAQASYAASLATNSSLESLSESVKVFQLAAGYFAYLAQKPAMVEKLSIDFHPDATNFLSSLMLVNAQVMYYEVACLKTDKSNFRALFAMRIVTLLNETGRLLSSPVLDGVSKGQDLHNLLRAWTKYYAAVAHDWQHNMEDRLAHLREAASCIAEAANLMSKMKGRPNTQPLINYLRTETAKQAAIVRKRQEEADEQNLSFVYASASEVCPTIKGDATFQPTSVETFLKEPAPEEMVKGFRSVVPKHVRNMGKQYLQQAGEIVQAEVTKLDAAGAALNGVKQELATSLTTSSRPAVEDPRVESLLREAIAAGGYDHLEGLEKKLIALNKESRDQITTIEASLAKEESDDEKARTDTKGMLRRPNSAELNRPYRNACGRILSELEQARKTDEFLSSKLHSARTSLACLVDKPRDTSAPASDAAAAVVQESRQAIEEATTVLTEMSKVLQNVKEAYDQETSSMTNLPTDREEREKYFAARLRTTYDPLQEQVQKICSDAEEVRTRLVNLKEQRTGGEHRAVPNGGDETNERPRAVELWSELRSNFAGGLDFYSREQEVIQRVRFDVDGFTAARAAELQEHMSHLSAALQNMNLSASGPPRGPPPPAGPPAGPPGGPHGPPRGPAYPGVPHNAGPPPPPYGGGGPVPAYYPPQGQGFPPGQGPGPGQQPGMPPFGGQHPPPPNHSGYGGQLPFHHQDPYQR